MAAGELTAPAASGLVGHFHTARIVRNRRESLTGWRVTTNDPTVASTIAQLFGGTPDERDATNDDRIEVLTPVPAVRIVLDGPGVISTSLKLQGKDGLTHHCDGDKFLSPDSVKGRLCGCPPLLADRKARAMSGLGPTPHTVIYFRLVGNLHLGTFRFDSTSWKLNKDTQRIVTAIASVGSSVACELSIETIEFTTPSGLRVPYRNPAIKVFPP